MSSVPRLTIRDSMLAVAPLLLLMGQGASTRADSGPQGVVRQFCQVDGLGQRASLQGWAAVGPLVGWSFEPAWDKVVLIAGYTVGSPQAATEGVVKIDVGYDVLSTVSAELVDASPHVETVTFRLRSADGVTWRIDGPPPPPHILGPRVDVDVMRQSLQFGGLNFLADSVFVLQMYRSAGWNVGFKPVADLLDGTFYGPVGVPQAGDLVVYLRDGTPYHVGIVEGDDQIVSSTLNAGIVRTSTDAFAGEVKYLRLVSPESSPASDPAVDAPPAPVGTKPTVAADAAVRHAGAKPAQTPHPVRQPPRAQRLAHEKTSSGQPVRRTPQPSASRHVKKRVGKATTKPPPRSTPSAQLPAQ